MSEIRIFLHKSLAIRNKRVREFLAEALGTGLLVLIGNGAVAQMVLSKGESGQFLSVNWAYGLGVAFGVYISAGISGGHLNPAISLSQLLLGNISFLQLVIYTIGQTLGAFLISFVLFAVYFERLDDFDPNRTAATAGIWSTFPAPHLSAFGGLIDQIVGTSVLSMCVLALTDRRNTNVPTAGVPALVGAVVAMIGMSFGYNAGYAINPARDIGPRLFLLIMGYDVAFNDTYLGYNWFWVPIVGPLIGAVIGALLYKLFIGLHWPDEHQHRGSRVQSIHLS